MWKSEKGERRMDAVDVIRWCSACGIDAMDLFRKLTQVESRR